MRHMRYRTIFARRKNYFMWEVWHEDFLVATNTALTRQGAIFAAIRCQYKDMKKQVR
jgi:hypothetical protein